MGPQGKKRLWSVEGNTQRLDGGAMFGNAPRALWKRWAEPDDQNRIALSCRALLVDDGERRILFETGVGAFLDPKLAQRYGVVDSRHLLCQNLAALGFSHECIDVVVLSHLHFDHAGGLLSPYQKGAAPKLLFPNARFVVSNAAWERALQPHARDRASFITELQPLLAQSGRLHLVDDTTSPLLGPAYKFHFSEGHTPGLMATEIACEHGPLVFAADLIPGVPWVHAAITMGYDRYPERLIDEKSALLNDLYARGGYLFFTHDNKTAVAKVHKDEKNRFLTLEHQEVLDGVAF